MSRLFDKGERGEVRLYVDLTLGKKPLPVVLLKWDNPDMDHLMFEGMKKLTKAQRTNSSRWHRWLPQVWSTDNLLVAFAYKEADPEHPVTITIAHPDVPQALVQSAPIINYGERWYEWRSAYQETNYFVICCGTPADNALRTGKPPVIRLRDFARIELGNMKVIEEGIEEARAQNASTLAILKFMREVQ